MFLFSRVLRNGPQSPRASGGEEAAPATHKVLTLTRLGGHEKDFSLLILIGALQVLCSINATQNL
jgi:hypothetical protein